MCVSLDTLHAGLLRQVCMRKTVDEPRRGFVDGLRKPLRVSFVFGDKTGDYTRDAGVPPLHPGGYLDAADHVMRVAPPLRGFWFRNLPERIEETSRPLPSKKFRKDFLNNCSLFILHCYSLFAILFLSQHEVCCMRIIKAEEIGAAVAGLCVDAACRLPEDVLGALRAARDREEGAARAVLEQILENEAMARAARRPCCQDTGLAVVFLDIGQDVFIEGDVNAAVDAGVREAYTKAYLRKSSLSALSRVNTGDNTPAVLHVRFVPGDRVTVAVAPKGFGSENMSRLFMLTPSEGREGALGAIVETARLGAANACPPVILGVGVGGTMEAAAILAKRQLLRSLSSPAETADLAAMEEEALARVNALRIGPMGFGGKTTALRVLIGELPTHLAGLPVAVNVQCHCARHASAVL